jgi:hypothetical protein
VARLGFVDRDDLLQWGHAQGAPADLPDLVRQLILETTPGVVSLGFAAGGGIYGSGWDGTARATTAGLNVPAGLSLWELSTRSDVNVKADEDYDKRTDTPDGTPRTHATYVAVSTRGWKDRAAWARDKRSEGRWANVEALAVDDLDTWLQHAPVTHAWLSEKLGFQPHGLITAQAWWDRFAHETIPALPPEFLLSGREGLVEALGEEFARPGKLITVSGASREDILAFLSAMAVAAAPKDGGALLARAAYVDRVEAYRRWQDLKRPLLLAALTDEVAREMSVDSRHHLIIPVVEGSADFDLPPVDAQLSTKTLAEAGAPEELATEIGELARLSLLAARRRIAAKPELHRPAWAVPPVARIPRRIVLLGRFSESAEGDVAIVQEVVAANYATAAEEITALTVVDDPLLVRLGTSIGTVSQLDAWLLIVPQLRKEDFEAFHVAALKVLTESDPRHELAPEEQWQAGVLGAVRAYSGDLRQGLATTLALMGAYGDQRIAGARLTPRDWAAWIVRQTLEAANGDDTGHLWASLNDVIPLLAEAAPDEFMGAVRAGLAGEDPVLARVFTDDESRSSLFGGNSHSGLLWALERVSWSEERFGAIVDVLARWAALDPGGSYANRPKATLVDFFRAWYPQTSVNPERRLAVLDHLRSRHPDVAWELLLGLLPTLHSHATNIAAPSFRDWRKRDEPTNADVAGFYEAVTARAINDAGSDSERLAVLVDHVPTLPPEGRAALFARLAALADKLANEQRSYLWNFMRAEVAKNREFNTAVWALPDDDLERLEALSAAYQPVDALERYRFLFDEHMPSLPGVDRSESFGEYASAIAQARAEAAGEIAASTDWEGVLAFARAVKVAWFFGPALAEVGVKQHDPQLLSLLESDETVDLDFASSYFGWHFRQKGWPWLEDLLTGDLSPRQRARLLLATQDFPAAWEHLDGEELTRAFWQEFRTIGLGADFAHVATAVEGLYSVKRFGAGLDLLQLYLGKDSEGDWAEQVATGLEALLRQENDEEIRHLSQYGLRALFDYLERVVFNEERLARLEWAYLPAFEFEAAPPTLSRYLASTPSFFVDVVSRIFRPGDEEGEGEAEGEEDEPDEQQVEIARNAFRLLSEWRTLPGREGNDVDLDVLRAWVEEARAGLREARRLRVGDNYIGKLLASSPPDPDGAWPSLAVREVLEAIDSEEIEQGFGTEIFNSLGVTSRGMLDGGDLERDRAARYAQQANLLVDGWPKSAQLLREAALTFERLASDHDDDAERRRTGFER